MSEFYFRSLILRLRKWSSESIHLFYSRLEFFLISPSMFRPTSWDAKVSPSSHPQVSYGTVAQSWCPEGGSTQSQLKKRGPLQDQRMESIWRGNEEWQETRCMWGPGQKVLDGWQDHQLPGNRVAVFLACDGIDAGRCPVKANPHQVKCSRSWDSNSSRSQGLLLSCQNPG